MPFPKILVELGKNSKLYNQYCVLIIVSKLA